MLVTLMTDASHCPNTGAGGYGFWCATERGKLPGGGPLAGVIKDSYEAEMKAVANSLKCGINAGLILEGDRVLVQLDHQGVVGCINGVHSARSDVKCVLDYIFNTAKELNLKVFARHVKGHSKNTEARYASNNHCDVRAGKGMQQAKEKLKNVVV